MRGVARGKLTSISIFALPPAKSLLPLLSPALDVVYSTIHTTIEDRIGEVIYVELWKEDG